MSAQLNRTLALAARLALAGGAVVVAFAASTTATPNPESPLAALPQVRTATVEHGPSVRTRTAIGALVATDIAVGAFTVAGRIVSIDVEIGDRVSAGQRIASLDCAPYRNQVDGTRTDVGRRQAELDQARADLARVEQLVARDAAVIEELEQRQTAVALLEAALDGAEVAQREASRTRGECVLAAPASGVVAAVLMAEGATAAPGLPVVQIDAAEALEVVVGVPEAWLAQLDTGTPAQVDLVALGRPAVPSAVGTVVRTAQPGSLYPVRIPVPASEDLVPGMTAAVTFDLPTPPSVTVPLDAIVSPGGRTAHVLHLRGDRVAEVTVETGEVWGDRVSVVATGADPLGVGSEVVVVGHAGLGHDAQVEVVR